MKKMALLEFQWLDSAADKPALGKVCKPLHLPWGAHAG
jgi:hypothetical protein